MHVHARIAACGMASRQRPAGGVGLTRCKEVLLLLLRRLFHFPNSDLQMGHCLR